MRRTILLTVSLTLAGVWSLDVATGQTSATPPVSLAPPKAASNVGARTSPVTSPVASDRASSIPATGGPPSAPNPAVDYDGLNSVEDNDTPDLSTRPTRLRVQSDPDKTGTASQQLIDQDDEALKRKLTICKSCR